MTVASYSVTFSTAASCSSCRASTFSPPMSSAFWRGAHFGGQVHIAHGGGRDERDRGVLGVRIDDLQVHAGLQGQRTSARALGHYSRLPSYHGLREGAIGQTLP